MSTERPRLLDLFCGAGGAAMGYHRAGFDVVGVDIAPQPRYPFESHQGDALDYLDEHWHEFDAIHASPPCPRYSSITPKPEDHPDLVGPTRDALSNTGKPWVIENVPGAPLHSPVILCGASFGLRVRCQDGRIRSLRRHRLFESNVWLWSMPCACSSQPVGVYGDGGGGPSTRPSGGGGYKATAQEARTVMGIDWADRRGIGNAIPPAYTEFIGAQLFLAVTAEGARMTAPERTTA